MKEREKHTERELVTFRKRQRDIQRKRHGQKERDR